MREPINETLTGLVFLSREKEIGQSYRGGIVLPEMNYSVF